MARSRIPASPLAGLLLASTLSAAQEKPRVRIEAGVAARMRDGVSLVADVYRPDAPGRYPVLLQRTPYDRKGGRAEGPRLAEAGYVVIIQDTRGRYDSEGEFYPFRHEAEDGYDTVEWAAALPYADGRVGMYGGSYVGATQMLAASLRPPHLVAIFPYVTASDYYEGWTYQGGALMQWFTSSWSSELAIDTLRRKGEARRHPEAWVKRGALDAFPVAELPEAAGLAPYFFDWISHETSDDYWRRVKVSDRYGEMTVRGLHGAGWHDIFLKGSIENYLGLRDKAATPEARRGQRLVVGPWAHAPTSPEGRIGDVVFGAAAVLDFTQLTTSWFDHALKGAANEWAAAKPVRLFVMGENAWRDEAEFPLARARATRYFLAPGARREDGQLATAPSHGGSPSAYAYDPDDPVPTLGGRLCCGEALAPGPFDQRPNESRADVLVFSTPPLGRALEVTGFVTLELYAATTAADTDFTALLADVDPGGYARFLTDGIVRARYRRSTDAAQALVPGRIEKYTIDLWATSNLFKAGHRLRLYVSSSNFPRFDRNRNTGEPIRQATRSVKARQTIYHDVERPSALVVPVVPR